MVYLRMPQGSCVFPPQYFFRRPSLRKFYFHRTSEGPAPSVFKAVERRYWPPLQLPVPKETSLVLNPGQGAERNSRVILKIPLTGHLLSQVPSVALVR